MIPLDLDAWKEDLTSKKMDFAEWKKIAAPEEQMSEEEWKKRSNDGKYLPLKEEEWNLISEGGQNIPKDPHEWDEKYNELDSSRTLDRPEKVEEYFGDTLLNPQAHASK